MSASPATGGPARLAAENGLPRLGGRPTLGAYLRQLWERRDFAIELARSRFRAQNEADRLGAAWIVLLPSINAAVYWFVFDVLLRTSGRMTGFVQYLVIGVFTFQLFSASLADGAKAIINNKGLVRTLHFPRAVLPIAAVMQQVFALVPTIVVMCLIVLATGEPITVRWLLLVPSFLLMILFCMGVAFFAARATIHVRDIAQLIPFTTRLIFYVSGIFFVVGERFDGVLKVLLQINPVHVYITLVRNALLTQDRALEGVQATALTWYLGIGWALVMLVAGFLFFWRAEGLYGRD